MNKYVKLVVDATAAPAGVTSAIAVRVDFFVGVLANIAGLMLTILGIAWYIARFIDRHKERDHGS